METRAKTILEELKKKYGISDEKIAVKLGVSAITIYRWRLGKFRPSVTELKLLQRILQGYKNVSKQKQAIRNFAKAKKLIK